MNNPYNHHIAYFISPHGYGHAARAAAVMEAVYEIDPAVQFEIFTMVPKRFFEDSFPGYFTYHSLLTDIGLVQKTPFLSDIPETIERLDSFLPFNRSIIEEQAVALREKKCRLVICDIAPMGIAVAMEAGIPSLLVENFTWDWIYEEYLKDNGGIDKHIRYLKKLFVKTDFHVQTEPVCTSQTVDLTAFPVSRKIRTPSIEIREKLGIPEAGKMVMITLGGIPGQYGFLKQLESKPDVIFLIPGAVERFQVRGNIILLPHHSDFFHPDLVNASDAVIGKAGYSTLAEIHDAGTPFGYVVRDEFRESRVLVSFIKEKMSGRPITEDEFHNGNWLKYLSDLLKLPGSPRQPLRGAVQVANFIYGLINSSLS